MLRKKISATTAATIILVATVVNVIHTPSVFSQTIDTGIAKEKAIQQRKP
jgi:hypothetical protein